MHQASLGRRKRFDSRSSYEVSVTTKIQQASAQDSLSRFSLNSATDSQPVTRARETEKDGEEGVTLKVIQAAGLCGKTVP